MKDEYIFLLVVSFALLWIHCGEKSRENMLLFGTSSDLFEFVDITGRGVEMKLENDMQTD